MKVMFCHDGSENGHQALKAAIEYFKPLKPEMVLLCVSEDVGDASMEVDSITEEYQKEKKAIMEQAAKLVVESGMDVDVIMAIGDPRRLILDAVDRKKPNVVVVARKEKSARESVFRRSVSAYLVKNAGCHLFIMGPLDQQ